MDRSLRDPRRASLYGQDLSTCTAEGGGAAEDEGAWLFSFVDILTLLVTLLALLLAYNYLPHRSTPRPTPAVRSAKATPARPPPPPATAKPALQDLSLVTEPQVPGRDAPVTVPAPPALAGPVALEGGTAATRTAPPAGPQPHLMVPSQLKDQVTITRAGRHINVVIKDDVLFATGSDRLTPTGRSVLNPIARMLNRTRYPVSVEGHTDDTPIHTPRFPSNWELSTARATNVTRYLIGCGVAARRLRAIGYGDTRPVAANDTPAGRAQNRRVALVLHVNEQAPAGPIGTTGKDRRTRP